MSKLRRRLMMQASRLIDGIDFSAQPDNEVWYVTTDGALATDSDIQLIGGSYRQEGLRTVAHFCEDGICKVRYNAKLEMFGERAFYDTRNIKIISLPRTFSRTNAFSLGTHSTSIDLIFLYAGNVYYNGAFPPNARILYVQKGCGQFYKNLGYKVIEKNI